MNLDKTMESVKNYFDGALKNHGATPQGADWNSEGSQASRFDQLMKVIEEKKGFTVLDYGGGYGAFVEHLISRKYLFEHYYGFDILESMVVEGRNQHSKMNNVTFSSSLKDIPDVDYTIASGVFNFRAQTSYEEWTQFTIECLETINKYSRKGFSSNFLTKYSDEDHMRPDLYYADPCFIFDYCKTHFSKNVALLHDYKLYDFTIIVRKYSE
jgi:cyclopropane fatty-acyl-phospholipid synthase-like methyltransferase